MVPFGKGLEQVPKKLHHGEHVPGERGFFAEGGAKSITCLCKKQKGGGANITTAKRIGERAMFRIEGKDLGRH